MADDALFYVGQKAFIEKDGKILVIRDPIEGIDFPGGKIQEGEAKERQMDALLMALKREVKEETGLEIEVKEPFVVWYHEFTKEHRNYPKKVYLVGFRCRYISGDLKLSEEHDKFEWVDEHSYKNWDDGSDYYKALARYYGR